MRKYNKTEFKMLVNIINVNECDVDWIHEIKLEV